MHAGHFLGRKTSDEIIKKMEQVEMQDVKATITRHGRKMVGNEKMACIKPLFYPFAIARPRDRAL